MASQKKQMKITKYQNNGWKRSTLPINVHDELDDEIQELEKQLKDKQYELFRLQRNFYKDKLSSPKKKSEIFIRPQDIVMENSIETLKKELKLMSVLTGIEVQSYVAGDHCCVLYHMQTHSIHEVKHGLRINMKSDVNEIEKISMPVGFNINAIIEEYTDVMTPNCLGAIRKALYAYYERLHQFDRLKSLIASNAQLFKLLDGSHMEISFVMQKYSQGDDESELLDIILVLDYKVYDITPKITFRSQDLTTDITETLQNQCIVFKRKPLAKAFKEAFLVAYGDARYLLVQQHGEAETMDADVANNQKGLRRKRNAQDHNHDDTFRPEDCSEPSDDDAD